MAVGVEDGRIGPARGHRVRHGGQHFVVDMHERQRGLRLLERVGHDERKRVAHIARRVGAAGKGGPIVVHQAVARDAGDVAPRQHRMNARRGQRGARVNRKDAGVGMLRAQCRAMEHARKEVVVAVERFARDLGDRIGPWQSPCRSAQAVP